MQLPILNRAVSPLHLSSLRCALLQTHPVPLSRSGKNQGGQSPWSAVIKAKKVTSRNSLATPRARLFKIGFHYSYIQFALTGMLCSEILSNVVIPLANYDAEETLKVCFA